MTHVTCRLTAKNQDQLRNPTFGNRVWATFLHTWSLMNRFRTSQGPRHANLHKWGLAQSPSCDCGQRQTMNHIVDTCPLTKSEDGLNVLHEVALPRTSLHTVYSKSSDVQKTTLLITKFSRSINYIHGDFQYFYEQYQIPGDFQEFQEL